MSERFIKTYERNIRNLKDKEAVSWRCSVKRVLLQISQNLQENTCASCRLRPTILLKSNSGTESFLVNFVKFLRTDFSIEHLQWLLLKIKSQYMKGVLKDMYIHNLDEIVDKYNNRD